MTRLANIPPLGARIVLVSVIAVSLFGIWMPPAQIPVARRGQSTDASVYRAIVDRVRGGEAYEKAALSEQRARGFPVRPFLAVRPPALATILAWFPKQIDIALEILLAVGVICGWTIRLASAGYNPRRTAWAAFFVFTGVGAAMTGEAASLFHEAWAGLLIALSLALRTEKHFVAAVALGLLAALIRELAMPYLLVMALFAVVERRRAEAIAFALALAVAAAALAWHAQAVMALVTNRDLSSPGWLAMGGWPFVLATAKWNAIVPLAGSWTAAVIVPLALIGAVSWKDAAGLRLFTLLAGYVAGFVLLGRPENRYWGLVTAPLVGVALGFAPLALLDLYRRAVPAPRAQALQ